MFLRHTWGKADFSITLGSLKIHVLEGSWPHKQSLLSVLQYSSPCLCQEILQMWGVRTFIRTFLDVSWSWERAWTTIRRTWPVRGEWQLCAGDNNYERVSEWCEQYAASICDNATSLKRICFIFIWKDEGLKRNKKKKIQRIKRIKEIRKKKVKKKCWSAATVFPFNLCEIVHDWVKQYRGTALSKVCIKW